MKILHSDSVTSYSYSASTVNSLESGARVEDSYCVTGVSNDGSLCWVARGNVIEVLDPRSGERLNRCMFGVMTKECTSTQITAVCEYTCTVNQFSNSSHWFLLVATTSLNQSSPGGLVNVFDLCRGIVIRCIKVPFEVTSIESVYSDNVDNSIMLSHHLQKFSGLAALGTHTGHIYIIDLQLDDSSRSTEQRPLSMEALPQEVYDIRPAREALTDSTFYVELGESSHQMDEEKQRVFVADGSMGSIKTIYSDEVYVSCIKHLRPIGCVAVGFNFGCVQIWRLADYRIELTLDSRTDLPSVSHITYQIPENDPRFCFYVWVVRGPTSISSCIAVDENRSQRSFMSLYQLVFKRRQCFEKFGVLFRHCSNTILRLEQELTGGPDYAQGGRNESEWRVWLREKREESGCRIISCDTLERYKKPVPHVSSDLDESIIEGCVSDSSLFVVIWETTQSQPPNTTASNTYLSVFDINCWYHAQMPSRFICGRDMICPYWSVYSLDSLKEALTPDPIAFAYVERKSVNQLTRFHQTTAQQFLQPSALSFNVFGWSERGMASSNFIGLQAQILREITLDSTHDLLIQPHDLFTVCVTAGLINNGAIVGSDSSYSEPDSASLDDMRRSVLTLMLNSGLTSVIQNTITDWTDEEHINEGCTVRLVFDWTIQTLTQLKQSVDDICLPLFEEGSRLELYNQQSLTHQVFLLKELKKIFSTFSAAQQNAVTLKDIGASIEMYIGGVEMLVDYVIAVLCFTQLGLLPELTSSDDDFCDDDDDDIRDRQMSTDSFRYPATALQSAYKKLRAELSEHFKEDTSSTSPLLIDHLMSDEGNALLDTFKRLSNTSLYPPNNIYTALSLLRVPGCKNKTKHSIILYLIKDLSALATNHKQNVEEVFEDYCKQFNLSEDLIRYITAIWLLDHQFFSEACRELVEVRDLLETSQLQLIVKLFLYQNESHSALRFINSWPLFPINSWEDVRLITAVYLDNRLIGEAMKFIRLHWSDSQSDQLLLYVINICLQSDHMKRGLMMISPYDDEGRTLIRLLRETPDKRFSDLLIQYHLHHHLYMQAMDFNKSLTVDRGMSKVEGLDEVLNSYLRVLRPTSLGFGLIADDCKQGLVDMLHRHEKSRAAHRLYDRPTPLSATLNADRPAALQSRASFLLTVLDKKRELKIPARPQEDEEEVVRRRVVLDDPMSLLSTPVVLPAALSLNRSIQSTSGLVFLSATKSIKSRLIGEEATGIETPTTVTFRSRLSYLQSTLSSMEQSLATLIQTPPIKDRLSRLASANSVRTLGQTGRTPQSILVTRSRISTISDGMRSQDCTVNASVSATTLGSSLSDHIIRTPAFENSTTKSLRFCVPDTSSSSSSASSNGSSQNKRVSLKRKISDRDSLHSDEMMLDDDTEITLNFRNKIPDSSLLGSGSSELNLSKSLSPPRSSLSPKHRTSQHHSFSPTKTSPLKTSASTVIESLLLTARRDQQQQHENSGVENVRVIEDPSSFNLIMTSSNLMASSSSLVSSQPLAGTGISEALTRPPLKSSPRSKESSGSDEWSPAVTEHTSLSYHMSGSHSVTGPLSHDVSPIGHTSLSHNMIMTPGSTRSVSCVVSENVRGVSENISVTVAAAHKEEVEDSERQCMIIMEDEEDSRGENERDSERDMCCETTGVLEVRRGGSFNASVHNDELDVTSPVRKIAKLESTVSQSAVAGSRFLSATTVHQSLSAITVHQSESVVHNSKSPVDPQLLSKSAVYKSESSVLQSVSEITVHQSEPVAVSQSLSDTRLTDSRLNSPSRRSSRRLTRGNQDMEVESSGGYNLRASPARHSGPENDSSSRRINKVSRRSTVQTSFDYGAQSDALDHSTQSSVLDQAAQPSDLDHGAQASAIDHGAQPFAAEHVAQPSALEHDAQPSAQSKELVLGEVVDIRDESLPKMTRIERIEVVSADKNDVPNSSIMFTPVRRSSRVSVPGSPQTSVKRSPMRSSPRRLMQAVSEESLVERGDEVTAVLSDERGFAAADNKSPESTSKAKDDHYKTPTKNLRSSKSPAKSSESPGRLTRSPARNLRSPAQSKADKEEVVLKNLSTSPVRHSSRLAEKSVVEPAELPKSPSRAKKPSVLEQTTEQSVVPKSPSRSRSRASVFSEIGSTALEQPGSDQVLTSPGRAKRTTVLEQSEIQSEVAVSPRRSRGRASLSEERFSSQEASSPGKSKSSPDTGKRSPARARSSTGEKSSPVKANSSPDLVKRTPAREKNVVRDKSSPGKVATVSSIEKEKVLAEVRKSPSRKKAKDTEELEASETFLRGVEERVKSRRRTVTGVSEISEVYLTPAQRALKARKESKISVGVESGVVEDLMVSKWSKPRVDKQGGVDISLGVSLSESTKRGRRRTTTVLTSEVGVGSDNKSDSEVDVRSEEVLDVGLGAAVGYNLEEMDLVPEQKKIQSVSGVIPKESKEKQSSEDTPSNAVDTVGMKSTAELDDVGPGRDDDKVMVEADESTVGESLLQKEKDKQIEGNAGVLHDKKSFVFSPPQHLIFVGGYAGTVSSHKSYSFSPPHRVARAVISSAQSAVSTTSVNSCPSHTSVFSTDSAPSLHSIPPLVYASSSVESLGPPIDFYGTAATEAATDGPAADIVVCTADVTAAGDTAMDDAAAAYDEAAVVEDTTDAAVVKEAAVTVCLDERVSSDATVSQAAPAVTSASGEETSSRRVGRSARSTRAAAHDNVTSSEGGARKVGGKEGRVGRRKSRDSSLETAQRLVKIAKHASKRQPSYSSPSQDEINLLTPPTPYHSAVNQAAGRKSSAAGRGRRSAAAVGSEVAAAPRASGRRKKAVIDWQ